MTVLPGAFTAALTAAVKHTSKTASKPRTRALRTLGAPNNVQWWYSFVSSESRRAPNLATTVEPRSAKGVTASDMSHICPALGASCGRDGNQRQITCMLRRKS